jgi:ribosomal protein S21
MFVNAREVESFEEVYRRFKRGIETAGSLREYRRKQRFKPAMRSGATRSEPQRARSGGPRQSSEAATVDTVAAVGRSPFRRSALPNC